jgi:hypothetical protein
MGLGIKLRQNPAFTWFQIMLIYFVALYLIVQGSFDIFSKIDEYHTISTAIKVMGLTSLLLLVIILNGAPNYDGLIKLNLILLVYEIFSFTILDESLMKNTIEPILVINLLYLFTHKTMDRQGVDEMFMAFRNIMVVLAISSVTLWILGPIMGKLSPSNTFYIDRGEKNIVLDVYYYIMCTGNSERDFLSFVLPSNNCIFREKAFAATNFFLALCYELFINKRNSVIVIGILYIALFSTTSTTSIVVGIIGGIIYLASKKGMLSARLLILLPIIWFAVLFIQDTLQAKFETHSGESRSLDLMNGINAWLDSPLFGHGYNNQAAYDFYKTGYSSSIAQILVCGGIYLTTIYFFPILKTIRKGIKTRTYELSAFAICVSLPLFINRGCFNANMFFILICLNYFYTSPKYLYYAKRKICLG